VLRGGSWINNGRNVRSANRNRNEPDNRNNNTGFRFALAQKMPDGKMMTRPLSRLRIFFIHSKESCNLSMLVADCERLLRNFLKKNWKIE
jgi:hypothetical protein